MSRSKTINWKDNPDRLIYVFRILVMAECYGVHEYQVHELSSILIDTVQKQI